MTRKYCISCVKPRVPVQMQKREPDWPWQVTGVPIVCRTCCRSIVFDLWAKRWYRGNVPGVTRIGGKWGGLSYPIRFLLYDEMIRLALRSTHSKGQWKKDFVKMVEHGRLDDARLMVLITLVPKAARDEYTLNYGTRLPTIPRIFRVWAKEEDEILLDIYRNGGTIKRIKATLHTDSAAVYRRLGHLNEPLRKTGKLGTNFYPQTSIISQ